MNPMTWDETTATCLALIAEAPRRNGRLLGLLKGDALNVAQIIIHPEKAAEFDPRIVEAAREIESWARNNRVNDLRARTAPAT